MSMEHVPRVMVAGVGSGSGKTTITCGLLAALKRRDIKASTCKCGPDYIDPMFHEQIHHFPSTNLDLYFVQNDIIKYLLQRNAKGSAVSVIEGVMGFYDGCGMTTDAASSYDLARQTQTPVILILPAKGRAISVLAELQGFLEFRKDHTIKGVILNGISPMSGKILKEKIEQEFDVKVYGCVPTLENFQLESRHLGLVTPYELENLEQELDKLGADMEQYLDIDGILTLAHTASDLDSDCPDRIKKIYEKQKDAITSIKSAKLRIGVARDLAFCFYYKDNLEFLKEMGCEIVPFSPLQDSELPKLLDAVIFGGGYPEIYARQLSENQSMRESVYRELSNGLCCMAECGGFMYLHEQMEDQTKQAYPMVGFIKGKTEKKERLVRFGYAELSAQERNTFLMEEERIKAHEFHYWDSDNNGNAWRATKPSGNRSWECMHVTDTMLAGYPHLYFYSNLQVPIRFLQRCIEQRKERGCSRCLP